MQRVARSLVLASLVACTGPAATEEGPFDAGLEAGLPDATFEAALEVVVDGPDPQTLFRRTGLWRVRVSWEGIPIADRVLGEGDTVEFPSTARFEGLGAGPFDLLAWFDRDGDARFEGCPFPPDATTAVDPGRFENISAAAAGVVPGVPVALTLERRLCGPGRPETALSGQLEPARPIEAGIYFAFRPSEACGAGVGPGPAEFTLSALPTGLAAPLAFRYGELLPGCYEVTVFSDDDGDQRPSPCGGPARGGDRFVTTVGAVALVAGQTVALEAPVGLGPDARCAEVLTGQSGRIWLATDQLDGVPAGQRPSAEAPLRYSLVPLNGGAALDLALGRTAGTPEAPTKFTITGLVPGDYRRVVYLDMDGDAQLSSCGGLSSGPDLWTHVTERVAITPDLIEGVGDLVLTRALDCDRTRTLLSGRVDYPVESGVVGSGRPLRLELNPRSAEGERRSLLLATNHLEVGVPAADAGRRVFEFQRLERLTPGSYLARFFLDTDRDGLFGSCELEPFGDRAADPGTALDLPPVAADGAASPQVLPEVQLVAPACVAPVVSVEPTLTLAEGAVLPGGGPDDPPLYVRIEITEAGGWKEAFPQRESWLAEPFPPSLPALRLAPGRFRMVVWLDVDPGAPIDPCLTVGQVDARAEVEFSLSAETPTASPVLALGAGCPR